MRESLRTGFYGVESGFNRVVSQAGQAENLGTVKHKTKLKSTMKTNSQSTPGPWSVWTFGESAIDLAVGPQAGGVAVCQIVTTQANGIATPEAQETGAANARLIASAPALLEALKQIIEAADDPDNGKDRDLVEMIDWDQARAAIAQAEGRGL